jgi:hypothetical protein
MRRAAAVPLALAMTDGQIHRVLVHPGEAIQVSGKGFFDGCNDTATTGCLGGSTEQTPAENVQLVLRQDGQSWPLGYANATNASEGYAVTWNLTLPTDVNTGPAVLVADAARAWLRVSR